MKDDRGASNGEAGRMIEEVRLTMRWMADGLDTASTSTARAVRRARRRLARTAIVLTLTLPVAAYGGLAALEAMGRVRRAPRPAAVTFCNSTWKTVPSPNVPGESSALGSVAAIAANDVWAVGYHFKTKPEYRPLIEHWDGQTWTIVGSPPVPGNGLLTTTAAVASDDVWAAGFAGSRLLLEHWDGTSWSIASSPRPGESSLASLSAVAANDVWAIGGHKAGGRSVNLAMHWNGSKWALLSIPNIPGGDNLLSAVSASGAGDAWAAGSVQPTNGQRGSTLTLHWDGAQWNIVPSPSPRDGGIMNDVGAPAPGEAWAVGTNLTSIHSLVEHWDGTGWKVVPSAVRMANLIGVSAFAPDDVWALGNYRHFTKSLLEHWNGSAWVVVPAPSPGSSFNGLSDLAEAEGRLWAVGAAGRGQTIRTLVISGCREPIR